MLLLSRVMRKPDFRICENKAADQLRSNCAADQRLCFRYIDSTISLLPKSEISSLWPSSVSLQPGLCRTWSETPKIGFLTTKLSYELLSSIIPLLLLLTCNCFNIINIAVFISCHLHVSTRGSHISPRLPYQPEGRMPEG